MNEIIMQYLITFGWAITGAVSMALSLSIVAKVFTLISPIDEWEALKNGNMAVALVLSSAILGAAVVIAFTVST